MLNEQEYLIAKLAEEAVEVAQRCTKILTFGLHETQEGKSEDNHDRLRGELIDLIGICDMLEEKGILNITDFDGSDQAILDKKAKVEKYMEYSRKIGTLSQCPTSLEK